MKRGFNEICHKSFSLHQQIHIEQNTSTDQDISSRGHGSIIIERRGRSNTRPTTRTWSVGEKRQWRQKQSKTVGIR